MHIILDIDQTLIYTVMKDEIMGLNRNINNLPYHENEHFITFERPYLQDFLDFLFSNFEVSIWTHGEEGYAEWVLSKILQGRKVKYLFHRDHCNLSYELYGNLKDLRMLWDNMKLDFNPSQTILIDDLESNCSHQPDKCIQVIPFIPYRRDNELNRVMNELKNKSNLANYVPKRSPYKLLT